MFLTALISFLIAFANPVLDCTCADPTLLDDRERSGWFYAYSTQSSICKCAVSEDSPLAGVKKKTMNLPVYRSKNLVDWELVGDGFPEGRPKWVEKSRLWAPDISYIDGKYILHYALGVWASLTKSACGVAVADSPEGPFKDLGATVTFQKYKRRNSIDPDLFCDDDGRVWLYWGSLGGGIQAIEMTTDGLEVKPGAKPSKRLSALNTEGAYMHKHNGKYYLFASAGKCCEGQKSTYRVVVARSDSPLGPFKGPDGKSFKNMHYQTTAIRADGIEFAGPGHNSGIVTDDAGQDWILFHCYDARSNWASRRLFLGRVDWDEDGWPVISEGKPSAEGPMPVL